MKIDWDDVKLDVKGMIEEEFEGLVKDGSKVVLQLESLSEEAAIYWARAAKGDEKAGETLKFIQAQVKLILATLDVKERTRFNRFMDRLLAVGAKIAVAAVKAVV